MMIMMKMMVVYLYGKGNSSKAKLNSAKCRNHCPRKRQAEEDATRHPSVLVGKVFVVSVAVEG